jgi:nucleoid DNA-binding protein
MSAVNESAFNDLVDISLVFGKHHAKLSKKDARAFALDLLRTIAINALENGSVRTPIGVFRRATTRRRRIKNPITGKPLLLPPSYRLAFRASKALKGVAR